MSNNIDQLTRFSNFGLAGDVRWPINVEGVGYLPLDWGTTMAEWVASGKAPDVAAAFAELLRILRLSKD